MNHFNARSLKRLQIITLNSEISLKSNLGLHLHVLFYNSWSSATLHVKRAGQPLLICSGRDMLRVLCKHMMFLISLFVPGDRQAGSSGLGPPSEQHHLSSALLHYRRSALFFKWWFS